MKKLLLSVLMSVVCFVVGAAQEEKQVTFDFANEDYGLTRITSGTTGYIDSGTEVKSGDVTITLTKTGTTGLRLWKQALRFYRNSDAAMTVSVPENCTLTKITYTGDATFALADGEAGEYVSADKTWTGSAKSVKLNYTLTTDNKDVSTIVVTYTEEADPGFELVEGDGSREKPYLCSQLSTLTSNDHDVWVAGYVVGYVSGSMFLPSGTFGTADGAPAERFLLGPTPDTNTLAECLDVRSISSKEAVAALDLQSNPDNIGKIVAVYCGTIYTAFGSNNGYYAQGITDYYIPGEGGETETYTLTVNANGCLYDLVGAEDLTAVEAGTEFSISITEIPAGKILKAVKLNGEALEGDNDNVYKFTVNENSVLDIELVDGYKVNILQNEGGTLKVMNGDVEVADGTYLEGETLLTLVATPDDGYALKGYTYNGNPLTGDMVIVEEDFTVSAEFEKTETKVEYVAPNGSTGTANYLTSLSTTGATQDISKEWTSNPGIYTVLEEAVTAEAGSTFTLNLVANSLGEGSYSNAREDIRYTAAYVFVDWYGTGEFELAEKYGLTPPTHNIYGNYDEVMNISHPCTVPEDVKAGTAARIRVIYSNAWTVPGETSNAIGETPYANSQNITNGIAYDIVVNTPAVEVPPVEDLGQHIVIPARDYSRNQLATLRFDDVPLGSHTNGTNNSADLRSRNLTYSAWIKILSASDDDHIMGNIQSLFTSACGAFVVYYKDGKLNLKGRDAVTISSFKDMTATATTDEGTPLDEWVFVSVVADQEAGTVTLYKNAKPISSYTTTYGVGLLPDESDFFIGDMGASVAFTEIQLWTKAMTPDELKAAYHASYAEAPEGLVAYYKAGELVEGSTTELANLGTEGSTTATVRDGTFSYNSSYWTNVISALQPMDLDHQEGTHEYKTVSVTLTQPEGEGNSFTVTGKDGREISDEAYLYETLTVQPTLAEGYELESVDVVEENGTENHYTLDQMPFLAEDNLTIGLTLSAPPVEVGQTILVPEGGSGTGQTLYSFRFDDAPLGSHNNGTNDDNDLRSRNFTYSAWINVRSTQGGVVMGNIQNSFSHACGAFLVTLKNGKLCLNGRDATALSSFKDVVGSESEDEGTNENEWVFVSVVADQEAGTVTLYKDAKPISSYSTTYGVGLLTDESSFFIGDAGTSVEISEVQLWTKAMTPAELKAAYHASYTEAPEGLVAYYKGGELVEGSTTELRNLGTEATTTAKVISGTYNLVGGWNPQFQSQVATEIQHNEGTHEYKTVSVTLTQPESEGNSFTVSGKGGREISDEAYLYETLTVQPTLAEDYELASVDVVEENGTENHYTLDQMPFLAEDNLTISLTLKAPAPEEYKLSATVENGTVSATFNETETVDITNGYGMIPNGAKVVVTLTPSDDNYELKSFKVNGEDAMDQLDGMEYTIAEMDAEYALEAVFAQAVCRVKIVNPETGTDGIYGEVVNNRMQHFDDEDEELGAGVPKGESAYVIIYTHPDYDLTSVTDNDEDVTSKLYNYTMGTDGSIESYIYILSAVSSDHTIVISQDKKVGIFGINADSENAISYVDGQLNVPANAVVEVYDVAGRKVASAVGTLSVDELVNGVYVARAAVEGKIFTLKFVKF